jgi:hypothetical protein
MGSLHELYKAITLVLGTLHFVGARFCCNRIDSIVCPTKMTHQMGKWSKA